MKRMKWLMVFAAIMVAATSCGTKKESPKTPKTLVLYYSQTSNTKTVAQAIAQQTGADIEEIVPVKPFDGDFQATIQRCNQERQQGTKTAIKPLKADVKKYDVIFIGYPIWFGTYAPPIATFLEQVDLSGKKVVPFCTFGSGGLETSIKDLTAQQPKAQVQAGYGVRAARLAAVPQEVDQFLKAGGYVKGEYTKLPEFSAAHAVSDAEKAIFTAAIGNYPMIQAEAKTVAQRTIPGGVEYLFTAADKPRPGAPQGPAPGQIQVYVTVLTGQAPEFTRVVR